MNNSIFSFRSLSIRIKLIISVMLTIALSLSSAGALFVYNEYHSMRESLSNEATALADTVGGVSSAAITFGDQKTANEILSSLSLHTNINNAAIFSADGKRLGVYEKSGKSPLNLKVEMNSSNSNALEVSRAVSVSGEKIGFVYISYNLQYMKSRIINFAILVFSVLFIAFIGTFWVASHFINLISRPIKHLSDLSKEISESHDYSIRAEKLADDETAQLTECINNMLSQIQIRDENLLIHQNNLEDLVAQRTNELRNKNFELLNEIKERIKSEEARKLIEEELLKSRKLESLGVMAGGIAHNFNNILTGVVGFISLSATKLNDRPDIKAYLQKAETSCMRAKELTRQMLTFARGGDPVKKAALIHPLINEAIDMSMAGSKVKCRTNFTTKPAIAEVDPSQIIQVLNNLLINSIQAMPDGGFVDVSSEIVSINADSPLNLNKGDYIKILLQDQGGGISDKIIHQIFDPYFTTKFTGTGLGLSSSYSIIKKHCGTITAESPDGGGAIFTIYIPLSSATPPNTAHLENSETAHELPATISGSSKSRILLMDDEDCIRELGEEMLTTMGYDITALPDGKSAVEEYKKGKESGNEYSLVILDLTVPGGMGGEVAAKLILDYDSKANLIVSSGYANEPIMANYAQFGFKGVIAKPYSFKELHNLLKEVLNK